MTFSTLVCVLAAIALLHVAARIASRRRRAGTGPAVALKVAALAGTAALFRLVFYHENQVPVLPAGGQLELIVLRDRSQSMSLPAGNRATRAENADRVLRILRRKVRTLDRETAITIRTFSFARNVVEEEDPGEALDPRGTRALEALERVAARTVAGPVLSLTDGCFEPAPAIGQARRQAENRGVGFYVVACAEENLTDAAVTKLDVQPINPSYVRVTLRAWGEALNRPLDVRLRIDGEEAANRRIALKAHQTVAFPMPETGAGWRLISVEAEPLQGEICTSNNRRQKFVEVLKGQTLLFLHGRPDREQADLARLLAADPSLSVVMSTGAEAGRSTGRATRVSLAVVGNVAPDQLPEPLREALRLKRIPALFRSGAPWDAWGFAQTPFGGNVPVADRTPLPIVFDPRLAADNGEEPALHLPLTRVPRFAVSVPGMVPLAWVDSRKGRFPVLLGDRVDSPVRLLCLLDSTWRWKLHPDPAVRVAYDLFWRRLVEWIRPRQSDAIALDVVLEKTPGTAVQATVRLDPGLAAGKSMDLRVSVTGAGNERSYRLTRLEPDQYRGEGSYEAEGKVEWWQAVAEVDGKTLTSPEEPVFREGLTREFLAPVPASSAWGELSTDPATHAAGMDRAEELIDRMLNDLPAVPTRTVRQRDVRLEARLALLVAALLSAGWWLEKRAGRRGES